ncbi:MAG: hypothetical protein HYR63_04980 [Proteobacteria bacterium]|nr:hypothetical protein [Pseudomonadota bacterium]MBI3496786.1 hypothetical protein [Pseudomonadota bacterium]
MADARKNAITSYRRRMRRRGLVRLEVQVSREDVLLIRSVAGALADPAHAEETRALLRERLVRRGGKGLKALLAAAPLDGIDLERARDRGRAIRL